METESEGVNSKENEKPETVLNIEREYECVICGQTTPSKEERPVGMVVLLQATSVLGHSYPEEFAFRKLPCNDEEKLQLKKKSSLASVMEYRIEEFTGHFDNTLWQMSINIGWVGGVHVQSCGHYLHIDCHKSYMQSLKSQSQQSQRHQNLAVERGEYSCPLCRQLANSVLPINPQMGEMAAIVQCYPNNFQAVATELSQLMSAALSTPISSILKAMAGILEDLTNSTYPQYRSVCSAPNPHSLLLFVCSIARTNLEIELIQRGGNFSSLPAKKSCFVPLFHVLALYTKVLMQISYEQLWSQLTGLSLEGYNSSLAQIDREVPLLLRDVTALLLQMVLTLPLNVDKTFYTCIVQVLYNLLCLQSVTQISWGITQNQRTGWKIYANDAQGQLKNIGVLLGLTIDYLEHSRLYIEDENLSFTEMEWKVEDLEFTIQNLCLPFLRIAALLQSHLYNEELLHIEDPEQEFGKLCQYLNLLPSTFDITRHVSPAYCLKWAIDKPETLISTWCQDFINFVNKYVIAGRKLLQVPTTWHQPVLLQLPENYDQIFQYYHRRSCSGCHSVPKDPSVCLVCGTMVCLRDNCCRKQSLYEAVAHSVNCGAGTAIFLAVNSSTIIVIRGKRACLWGSVYLDSFGEEDRDLKRGKPLYLSKERYNLLQQQWVNHSFDHTNKRWVWHKDNL